MTALLETLADHALGLDARHLPEAVLERARCLLLDTLSLMVAGVDTDAGRVAAAYAGHATGQARLVPLDARGSVEEAAWFGGVATFAHNFADTSLRSVAHSGTVVVPVLLAMGQARRVSGVEALAAVVIGYDLVETAAALLTDLGGRMGAQMRGFRPTPVCGPIGAAGVAARLRGLDRERTICALALGSHLGAGLRGGGPRLLREAAGRASAMWFHSAFAARHGLEAASLAELGVIDQPGLLEAPGGFLQAHAGLDAAPGAVEPPFRLGHEFAVLQVAPKLYCCAHTIAPAADAVLALRARLGLRAESAERVTVQVPAPHLAIASAGTRPADAVTAQVSYPYVLATCLIRGAFLPVDLTETALRDPAVCALADRIGVVEDPALTRQFLSGEGWPARVVLRLAGGAEYVEFAPEPEGAPTRPVGWARIVEKFRAVTAPYLSGARAEAIVEQVWRLEREENLTRLLDNLRLDRSRRPAGIP